MKLNDSTILRIKVPAHLYESVKRELTLKEGKNDFGMPGAKTVKVKDSSSGSAPKKSSAPKKANAPQKATGAHFDKETEKMGAGITEKKKAPKDGHKKMGLDELKALAELLQGQISEMEKHSKKEKVEEGEDEEGHEGKKKVKEGKDLAKSEELTMEWNPNEPDEPEEFDPQDYEPDYATSGGRGLSRRDVRRKMSGLYSDDEIADFQQRDAVKVGRIPAPTQTPREKF